MTPKIVFDSPELACLHEAGHADAALGVGARIVEIVLYREESRSFGRTRVDRTAVQAPHIALGGFAAEYTLYRAGRLLQKSGNAPSEGEFIAYAIDNARHDQVGFFGGDFAEPDGQWPSELDERFMSYAIGHAEKQMRFDLVERIADALLSTGQLDEAAIKRLATPI
jgi:hypothetical protein